MLEKKKRDGKSLRAGLRVLKTYIARELFKVMQRAASGWATTQPQAVQA